VKRCPACGRSAILNAHYGICHPCVFRAKRIAAAVLAGDTAHGKALTANAPQALIDAARRLYERMREKPERRAG
jgi:NAD(P)H-nitrite reductase large subunit